MRTCGACQLCCTLMAVQTLGKGMGEPCAHAQAGRCAVYRSRPYACRLFDCLWLCGEGTEWQRPDRIHAVWTALGRDLVVHEDAAYEGVGRKKLARRIAEALGEGRRVFLYVGGGERLELVKG